MCWLCIRPICFIPATRFHESDEQWNCVDDEWQPSKWFDDNHGTRGPSREIQLFHSNRFNAMPRLIRQFQCEQQATQASREWLAGKRYHFIGLLCYRCCVNIRMVSQQILFVLSLLSTRIKLKSSSHRCSNNNMNSISEFPLCSTANEVWINCCAKRGFQKIQFQSVFVCTPHVTIACVIQIY